LELNKSLRFQIGSHKCLYRTLAPTDVSESYIRALKEEQQVIEHSPSNVNIEWQQGYVRETLRSSSETICGLFVGSELIGTSGIQNLSPGKDANRWIELACGGTYDCTLGILVFSQISRGRGYGKTLVWASCFLSNSSYGIETFKASMKKHNVASLKSFLACGFQVNGESENGFNVELSFGELKMPGDVNNVSLD